MRLSPLLGLVCFATVIASQGVYVSRSVGWLYDLHIDGIDADGFLEYEEWKANLTLGEEYQLNKTQERQQVAIANKILDKAQEFMDEKLDKVFEKVTNKVVQKAKDKIQGKLLKVTSRVLTKIAKKTGIKLLARLGLKAGKKAAIKLGTALATKLGTTLSSASSSGPAFPFVAAAMLAFDVPSFALDMLDAGGYQKMGTVAEYRRMKEGVDRERAQKLKEEGGESPSIVGPLDRLNDTEYEKLVNATAKVLMNLNAANPVTDNLLLKLAVDIAKNQLNDTNVVDDEKVDLYAALVNTDAIFDMVCIELNGKVIVISNGSRQCSYKDREKCDSSYQWRMPEDENTTEIYAEYHSTKYGDACVAQSYNLRSICEGNHLPYDYETGICKINETYCKMKGADYAYSNELKAYDCKINFGQGFAEAIFGTAIVRGLLTNI